MKIAYAALFLALAALLATLSSNRHLPEKNNPMLPRTQQLIAEKQPVRVVLYGDSISEVKPRWNGGARTPEANWGAVLVKQLSKQYTDSEFTLHHFAIGGQNSYEGLESQPNVRYAEIDRRFSCFD